MSFWLEALSKTHAQFTFYIDTVAPILYVREITQNSIVLIGRF
jgi:hypothetical protein